MRSLADSSSNSNSTEIESLYSTAMSINDNDRDECAVVQLVPHSTWQKTACAHSVRRACGSECSAGPYQPLRPHVHAAVDNTLVDDDAHSASQSYLLVCQCHALSHTKLISHALPFACPTQLSRHRSRVRPASHRSLDLAACSPMIGAARMWQ